MNRNRIISRLIALLLLACSAWQIYAQQIPENEPEPSGQDSVAATEEAPVASEGGEEDESEAGTEATDENFVPSQQISEDLSVSFPVDI